MNEDDTFFTVKDLAAMFKVNPATIYRRTPKWPHHRVGTEIRFSRADVEAIKEMTSKRPAQPETRRSPRIGTRAARASERLNRP